MSTGVSAGGASFQVGLATSQSGRLVSRVAREKSARVIRKTDSAAAAATTECVRARCYLRGSRTGLAVFATATIALLYTHAYQCVSVTYTSVRFASRTPMHRMRHVLMRVRWSRFCKPLFSGAASKRRRHLSTTVISPRITFRVADNNYVRVTLFPEGKPPVARAVRAVYVRLNERRTRNLAQSVGGVGSCKARVGESWYEITTTSYNTISLLIDSPSV